MMHPSPALLAKLASIAVHADEYLSPDGHPLDRDALLAGVRDPEVVDWVAQMTAASMAPRKRKP